jgi:hypothetical protein
MKIRSEQHRQAIKTAFQQVTSHQSWQVISELADDTIRALEVRALNEDDEAKREAYIFDARGARKFWNAFLRNIEIVKNTDVEAVADDADSASGDDFLEVVM